MILEKEFGIIMNHKKIIKIMQKYDLRTKVRRKNNFREKINMAMSDKICPNLVKADFKNKRPNTYYCTDITYLNYSNNRAYLSAFKDIATGEIVAYEVSRNLKLDFVLESIRYLSENNTENLIIHSDQGIHYRSKMYQELLKDANIKQSMSRKGHCTDNAPIESFFGHLKDEVDYKKCTSFDQIKNLIDNYIYYYNNVRCQWNKNKMTPVEYKKFLLAG